MGPDRRTQGSRVAFGQGSQRCLCSWLFGRPGDQCLHGLVPRSASPTVLGTCVGGALAV